MSFQPTVDTSLVVDGVVYRVAEHPSAPGVPYGQEGRQAVVYQLLAGSEQRALKVFKPRYRVPSLVSLARRLAAVAGQPGLAVCRRTVLAPQTHDDLLRRYPDLTYAVLMPWIPGPTWMEIMLEQRVLSAEQSLALTRSLAMILAELEQEELAHCDLSGANLILPVLVDSTQLKRNPRAVGTPHASIELVDVEQLYGSDLRRPALLPAGSPGYAHVTAAEGLWVPAADRFAGAALLVEMLGWCDPRVRDAAWGESYFEPGELQQPSARYQVLLTVLAERWGLTVGTLLTRAWDSRTIADCPTFGEWLVALPRAVPVAASTHSVPPALLAVVSQLNEATGRVPGGEPPLPVADLMMAQIFAAGQAAAGRGEWHAARELFAEVVRRDPDYSEGGQRAASLLAEVNRHLARRNRPRAARVLTLIASLVVGLLLLGALFTVLPLLAASAATGRAVAQAAASRTAAAAAGRQVGQTATTAAGLEVAAATNPVLVGQTATVKAASRAVQAAATQGAQTTQTEQAGATGTADASAQQAARAAEQTVTAQVKETQVAAIQMAAAATQAAEVMAQATIRAATQATVAAKERLEATATAQAGVRPVASRTRVVPPSATRVQTSPTAKRPVPSPTPRAVTLPVPQQISPPDGWDSDWDGRAPLQASEIAYSGEGLVKYGFEFHVENFGSTSFDLQRLEPIPDWGMSVPFGCPTGCSVRWRTWAQVQYSWNGDPILKSDYSPWRTFTIR